MIFEILGTLDEANAFLGLAVSQCGRSSIKSDLIRIQDDLSNLMGIVAEAANPSEENEVSMDAAILNLELRMAEYEKKVQNPKSFQHPGKTTLGALIDISRTIIRRVERLVVRHYKNQVDGREKILTYMNRLSSFLYIMRLFADHQ